MATKTRNKNVTAKVTKGAKKVVRTVTKAANEYVVRPVKKALGTNKSTRSSSAKRNSTKSNPTKKR